MSVKFRIFSVVALGVCGIFGGDNAHVYAKATRICHDQTRECNSKYFRGDFTGACKAFDNPMAQASCCFWEQMSKRKMVEKCERAGCLLGNSACINLAK